ncbi:uncharacterized protein LOC112897175 [Panicum hallii]|uniref:uncharacterized protein LOC112897175 n=1 Tax=Panicum hallii TaxID=206008 RepID=UPI000DF4F106|nr:uncharacterized protein LOC112897175 [Panicum hallii]
MRRRPSLSCPGHLPPHADMSRRASAARDRCLELERAIAGRVRSGSLGLDDAVKMFDELLPHARPASVLAFNQLLTAVSRAQGRGSSSSELVPSLFNRMARACSDKAKSGGLFRVRPC